MGKKRKEVDLEPVHYVLLQCLEGLTPNQVQPIGQLFLAAKLIAGGKCPTQYRSSFRYVFEGALKRYGNPRLAKERKLSTAGISLINAAISTLDRQDAEQIAEEKAKKAGSEQDEPSKDKTAGHVAHHQNGADRDAASANEARVGVHG